MLGLTQEILKLRLTLSETLIDSNDKVAHYMNCPLLSQVGPHLYPQFVQRLGS